MDKLTPDALRARLNAAIGEPEISDHGFDIAAAVAMRKQGMSVREVARSVGVSPATLFRVLRALEQSREGSCNAQEVAAKVPAGDSETMAQP